MYGPGWYSLCFKEYVGNKYLLFTRTVLVPIGHFVTENTIVSYVWDDKLIQEGLNNGKIELFKISKECRKFYR